jgi:hypothetical protein
VPQKSGCHIVVEISHLYRKEKKGMLHVDKEGNDGKM